MKADSEKGLTWRQRLGCRDGLCDLWVWQRARKGVEAFFIGGRHQPVDAPHRHLRRRAGRCKGAYLLSRAALAPSSDSILQRSRRASPMRTGLLEPSAAFQFAAQRGIWLARNDLRHPPCDLRLGLQHTLPRPPTTRRLRARLPGVTLHGHHASATEAVRAPVCDVPLPALRRDKNVGRSAAQVG